VIPEDGTFNPLTVLVVAPPMDQTELVRDALAQAGYSVVQKTNCLIPWKEVVEQTPDLLIVYSAVISTDGWMPVRHWNEQQGNRRIPVLMLLASEEEVEREASLSAVADDILFLPVRRLELLRRVRALLRVKCLQSELDHYSQLLESQLNDLRQLDRMKAEFMSVVSHELRTPLTPLVAYAEMLLDGRLGALNPQQEEAVQVMQAKTAHLQRLIEDLLSFVTMERGQERVRQQIVSLDSLFDAEAGMVAPRCRHKGVEFVRAWSPDLPKVKGDPQQLRRVLRHLLDNACKFTPAGGVVTLRAYPTLTGASSLDGCHEFQGPPPRVTVVVEDTGIGIPPEQQEHLFHPFYQVDSSLTRRYGGLGLGLALTRRILLDHGSTLQVQSEEGKGTTFSFSLPAYMPAPTRDERSRGRLRVR
jgi:signal transduction histidine kinase